MFITFEGIDLSGKSTQAQLLYRYLKQKKIKVLLVREPGGTEISEKIRHILLDRKNSGMLSLTEFLLFSSARHQLTEEVIKPHLKKGYIVLCDRYFDSSTAYQGYGGKVDIKTINTVNSIASSGMNPGLTFFIDIDLKESALRRKKAGKEKDRMEQKEIKYFRKVISGYRDLCRRHPGRFVRIDGKKPAQEILEVIIKELKRKHVIKEK
jgi:dTMP kinase